MAGNVSLLCGRSYFGQEAQDTAYVIATVIKRTFALLWWEGPSFHSSKTGQFKREAGRSFPLSPVTSERLTERQQGGRGFWVVAPPLVCGMLSQQSPPGVSSAPGM